MLGLVLRSQSDTGCLLAVSLIVELIFYKRPPYLQIASIDVKGLTSDECTSSSIGSIVVLLVGGCFANDLHHLRRLLFSVVHLGEYRELLTGCLWRLSSTHTRCCCR